MSLAKNSRGVTLIELLVVVTIMMSLLGIVGGSTILSVERVEAQDELVSVHNLIKLASVRAFASGSGSQIHFRNNRTVSLVGVKASIEAQYEHLYFPDQALSFSRNGFPDVAVINVFVRSKEKQIDLEPLLSNLRL